MPDAVRPPLPVGGRPAGGDRRRRDARARHRCVGDVRAEERRRRLCRADASGMTVLDDRHAARSGESAPASRRRRTSRAGSRSRSGRRRDCSDLVTATDVGVRRGAQRRARRAALPRRREALSRSGASARRRVDGGRRPPARRRAAGLPLVVGGRSSGARVACRTAEATGAVGVLCLAFPLQPPRRAGASPAPNRLSELDAVTVPPRRARRADASGCHRPPSCAPSCR